MARFRIDIGKQISEVRRPKVLNARDLELPFPALEDRSEELRFAERISIREEVAKISQPSYDPVSTPVPLKTAITALEANPASTMSIHEFSSPLTVPEPIPYTDIHTNFVIDMVPIMWESIVEVVLIPIETINVSMIPVQFASILSNKVSIFGMNYADKHWRKIAIPKDEIVPQVKEKSKKQKSEDTIVELKKRGRKAKNHQPRPSIWDLLFAVLQPPLTFDRYENLLLPSSPYQYQWEGIKFLIDNDHALLADDMGTGKTIMTIVALKMLIQQAKVHHVLILCPMSVVYQWKEHLDDWAPELTSYLIRNPNRDIRKALWATPMHIYITTYGTLRSDIENHVLSKDRFRLFDVVVLDEAHHIKNKESKSFQAIKKLKPKRRWALTGTPLQNKTEDLVSIFDFVHPGYLTSFDKRPEQIQARIKPYFRRRRKKDIMPELPPKIYETIELELDEDQEIVYRQAEAGIRNEFNKALAHGEKITKLHIFAKLNILKQICNFAPGKFTSPKTDSLKERIEDIIESGNKVIIFSQYVDEGVKKLEKILEPYGVAKIVGEQTDANRRSEIEKFKKNPEIPVLIASVKSGGEGLNLTEASYVVHFDHWWNPAVMWQAEDRVHRRGQKAKGINIYSYWMKDTIDDRIRQKLREKEALFEEIINGMVKGDMDELITVDEWLEMFGVKNIEVSKKTLVDIKVWQSMSLSEIRDKLYEISPSNFEGLVRELMHYLGYPNVKVTGKSHDGGIDVLSTRNAATGVERVAAQCKRYRGNVSVSVAREFFGAISNDKSIKQGFLVTTGEFTAECLQFCQSSGMIRAISGIELAKHVKQFGLHP